MIVQKSHFVLTTDAGGSVSQTLEEATGLGFSGFLLAIYYTPVTPYDATVDFSFTVPQVDLWVELNVTAAKMVFPRFQAHDTAGVGITRNSAGTPFRVPYLLVEEGITASITNGGNTKSGSFDILIAKDLDGIQEFGL